MLWRPDCPSLPGGSWRKVARTRPGRPSCFCEVARKVTTSRRMCGAWRRASGLPRRNDSWDGSSASREGIWRGRTSALVCRGKRGCRFERFQLVSLLIAATAFCSLQQGQGLAFIANYMVIFFIQLGIENPYMILLISKRLLSVVRLRMIVDRLLRYPLVFPSLSLRRHHDPVHRHRFLYARLLWTSNVVDDRRVCHGRQHARSRRGGSIDFGRYCHWRQGQRLRVLQ